MNIFDTYIPKGFSTVNSYLFVSDPLKEIAFLKAAFHANEINRTNMPNGDVANCILQIGRSCFMISQARDEFENMRTSFYLFTEDVDGLYQNALSNGGVKCFDPMDMDYDDRQAGVKDPAGNYWWISKRLVQKGYEE